MNVSNVLSNPHLHTSGSILQVKTVVMNQTLAACHRVQLSRKFQLFGRLMGSIRTIFMFCMASMHLNYLNV